MYSDGTLKWLPIVVFSIIVLYLAFNTVYTTNFPFFSINVTLLAIILSVWILNHIFSIEHFAQQTNEEIKTIDFSKNKNPYLVVSLDYYDKDNNNELLTLFKENNVMMGTHNSMTYLLNSEEFNVLRFINNPILDLIINIPIVKNIMVNISKTQTKNILQQFKDGIRFFDIRVSRNKDDNILYVDHGIVCCTFDEFCEIFFTALEQYPQETVFMQIKKGNYNEAVDFDPRQDFTIKYVTRFGNTRPVKSNINELNQGDIYLLKESTVWPNSNDPESIKKVIQSKMNLSHLDIVDGIYTPQKSNVYSFISYVVMLSVVIFLTISVIFFKHKRRVRRKRK